MNMSGQCVRLEQDMYPRVRFNGMGNRIETEQLHEYSPWAVCREGICTAPLQIQHKKTNNWDSSVLSPFRHAALAWAQSKRWLGRPSHLGDAASRA